MIDKSKNKIILAVLLVIGIVSVTVGVTYAFFNYTRTGTANTVSTGRIAFNSSQDGRINLTNIFPIDPEETGIMNDSTKVGTVAITVTGDTSYDSGVEYLVSAVNVNNTVGSKIVPISISATTSGTLGTSDDDYFTNRNTTTNHIYKVLANNTISNNDQLMVGYIAKGATGINGTITIKAYIDKNNIAISDTYDGTASDNNGTTTSWVDGREVFTTTEWNNLQGTGVSFQIRVEANEGVWVDDINGENDMLTIDYNTFTSAQKSSITEINFIRMSKDEINTHANLIDLTDPNGSGMVKGWIENNKLYIASPGITYFPQNSSGLFMNFTALQTINFNNINTSNVTLMPGMFQGCSSLVTLDLSNFDTSNVTIMNVMFQNCSSLTTLDLSSFDTRNVTSIWNMFYNATLLTTIYVSNSWSTASLTSSMDMFGGCTSLKGGGTPQTTYNASYIKSDYARIDGGANSATPGYLTLKTN